MAKAGDARTGPLPMHPMSVGDVLDGAFKVFKANAGSLFLIVGTIVVPLQLASSFLLRRQVATGMLDVLRDPTLAQQQQQTNVLAIGGSFVALLLALLSAPFIAGAVSQVVAASYLGQKVDPIAALKGALRRFPALLGGFLLVHLAEGVGLLGCVVGAVFVMPMFILVAPATVLEHLGPVQAMRRSWRLVRRRYWPVLGIALLTAMITGLLANLLSAAPTLIGSLLGGSFAWLFLAVGAIVGQMVAAPLVVIVSTLLYFDARIRWEGFDLQLLAADLQRSADR